MFNQVIFAVLQQMLIMKKIIVLKGISYTYAFDLYNTVFSLNTMVYSTCTKT